MMLLCMRRLSSLRIIPSPLLTSSPYTKKLKEESLRKSVENNDTETTKSSGNSTIDGKKIREGRNKLPDPDTLTKVAETLAYDLSMFFNRKQNSELIRADFVFENRILPSSKWSLINGGLQYYRAMLFFKIWGNIRFPFIVLRIREYVIDDSDGTIQFHWVILTMSQTRILLNYLPKQLWFPKNMLEHAKPWHEGISTYYVDGNGKTYRHIVDNKVPDSEKNSKIDDIKDKLRKLNKKTNQESAAPSFFAKPK